MGVQRASLGVYTDAAPGDAFRGGKRRRRFFRLERKREFPRFGDCQVAGGHAGCPCGRRERQRARRDPQVRHLRARRGDRLADVFRERRFARRATFRPRRPELGALGLGPYQRAHRAEFDAPRAGGPTVARARGVRRRRAARFGSVVKTAVANAKSSKKKTWSVSFAAKTESRAFVLNAPPSARGPSLSSPPPPPARAATWSRRRRARNGTRSRP
mmetsp:Transcript_8067/g.33745  ORF Transcript_8067/g.33745 Transcript_8067/m.33745 type:complete len:215 (-) Transcript_8067:990-1634(-)